MKPDKQRIRGAPRSKRFSSSRLFCFNASQVDDSDAPTPPPDREMPSWSSCFMVGEKMLKEKEKKKKVPVHSPAKATVRSWPARAVEESRSKKSSAKSRGIDDKNNNDKSKSPSSSREASKFNEDLNIEQQNLLQTKRRDYINVAQASFVQSLYPIQTRLKGNESRPYEIVRRSRKLGSTVGVGIMTITLAIMIFVGRGTAIICFCSCLYISQLAKASPPNDEEKIAPKKIVMDSAEYKKKVILEGFLERNSGRSLNMVCSKR